MKHPLILILFSGGLDSLLAVKILQQQTVSIHALIFKSPFIDTTEAVNYAIELDLDFSVLDMGEEALTMISQPQYGFGKGVNPCKDCKLIMLQLAREWMERLGAVAIATGEVVGQRPNSQLFKHLQLLEKQSGLQGRLLRPLSAKLLKPTIPEQEGIINREKLYDIEGRSRTRAIQLFHQFKLPRMPKNNAGCILTETEFAKKVQDHLQHQGALSREMFHLLKVGRHLRINPNIKLVVGRSQKENDWLEEWVKDNQGLLIVPDNFPGPSILVLKQGDEPISEEDIQFFSSVILRYTNKYEEGNARVRVVDHQPQEEKIITLNQDAMSESKIRKWMIVAG